MTIGELTQDFLFECEAKNYSKRTIHNYKLQLSRFERFLDYKYQVKEIEQLKPLHIKAFIADFQKRGCKPSYINDMLKAVKVLCHYAYQESYTDTIISERVHNLKEPKVLIHTFSEEEIKRMLRYYDKNDFLSIRNKTILMILFDTGIRADELIQMKAEQIQAGYFIIHGKGRKERVVPKNPIVSKQLLKYMDVRERFFSGRQTDSVVFVSRNGKKLTDEGIVKFMHTCATEVAVSPEVRVSPHTCRHTFAHLQLKNGLDLYTLSRLLGHESVAITQRYLESIQNEQVLSCARKTSVLSNL